MKVEHIEPFVGATLNVLETMAATKATAGKSYVKKDNKSIGVVSGLVGMASADFGGNMVLSFDEPAILAIVSRMLMEECKAVDAQVVDAVGELTNMIVGGAKRLFSEQGIKFDMATPVMIVGREVELTQLAKGPILVIPFSTPEGTVVVEANLQPKSA